MPADETMDVKTDDSATIRSREGHTLPKARFRQWTSRNDCPEINNGQSSSRREKRSVAGKDPSRRLWKADDRGISVVQTGWVEVREEIGVKVSEMWAV